MLRENLSLDFFFISPKIILEKTDLDQAFSTLGFRELDGWNPQVSEIRSLGWWSWMWAIQSCWSKTESHHTLSQPLPLCPCFPWAASSQELNTWIQKWRMLLQTWDFYHGQPGHMDTALSWWLFLCSPLAFPPIYFLKPKLPAFILCPPLFSLTYLPTSQSLTCLISVYNPPFQSVKLM